MQSFPSTPIYRMGLAGVEERDRTPQSSMRYGDARRRFIVFWSAAVRPFDLIRLMKGCEPDWGKSGTDG